MSSPGASPETPPGGVPTPASISLQQSITSSNLNKTGAAAAGTVGGGGIGVIVLGIMRVKYGIDLGPELSGTLAASLAGLAATLATFFVPLITAGQQRLIRELEK